MWCSQGLTGGLEDEADTSARQKSMAVLVQPLTKSCLGCAIIFHLSHEDWIGLLVALVVLVPSLQMLQMASSHEASEKETSSEPMKLRLDWITLGAGNTRNPLILSCPSLDTSNSL